MARAKSPEVSNSAAIERLQLLKKDASQLGTNARRTVKFLDKMTSGKNDLPHDPIIIQGPDEQYATWQEVEAHYKDTTNVVEEKAKSTDVATKRASGGALSQMLLDKLNFAPPATSPASTPPLSPTSSGPQSSKTSPEVRAATMAADKSPVPAALKPLLNPVAWYIHEKRNENVEVFFLTNSPDAQHLARDFSIPTKTIHQMRDTIGEEPLVDDIRETKEGSPSDAAEPEKKTLFAYEDESEEEELVFKPRGRGAAKAVNGRGSMRNKQLGRSPRPSFSSGNAVTAVNPPVPQNKPKIPVEEIDPDSFDRGSFGRGSGQLANVGNHTNHQTTPQWAPNGPARGGSPAQRGSFTPGRGHHRGRGAVRGALNGGGRGHGRLFVP